MKLESALNEKETEQTKEREMCKPHSVLLFSSPFYADQILTETLSESGDLTLILTAALF